MTEKTDPQPEIRDLLFGDCPISQWPGESASSDAEPWLSFAQAREALNADQTQEAVRLFQAVLAMPKLESRHYLQAWHFLREADVQPSEAIGRNLLGVVVEVALPEGLDLLAAYADGTARYLNHGGAAVIWEAPDNSLYTQIDTVLRAGQAVVDQIGTWDGPRPPAPATGQVRISMLTPNGLRFGQAPFDTLASDPLGGPVIRAATQLMVRLIEKADEPQA
jgi:hypothetical protein